MARIVEPTKEQLEGWQDWIAERPVHVRAVAERFEPWSLYRMKSTGHRVTLVSFGEEEGGGVSLTVSVLGAFNLVTFERNVFSVAPDDLEPCDLPGDDEPVGVLLTDDEEIDAYIDETRPAVLAARDAR